MRKFKKFAAMASAVALAACAVAPVAMSFSASAVTELTLTNPITDPASSISNVKAYKIFNTSYSNNSLFVDSWGPTSQELDDFIVAIKVDALGLSADTQLKNDADGAKHFGGILTQWQEDATLTVPSITEESTEDEKTAAKAVQAKVDVAKAKIEAFAKIAAKNLKNYEEGEYNATAGKVSFKTGDEKLANGYYVMTCDVTVNGTGNESYKTTSLGMLTVVNGEASDQMIGLGTAKVALPTVQKKVKEDTKGATDKADNELDNTQNNGDATTPKYAWNDVADYDIGDDVPFKLYGTMPSNLEQYDKYYYKFTDNLSSNFNKPESLEIKVDNTGTDKDVILKAEYKDGTWTVKDSSNNVVSNVTVAYVTNTDINGFTVTFTDIKTNQNADKDTLVTIDYSATLNESAIVGKSGQDNSVKLTYSNNPNDTGDGKTGDTPDDKVRVYTYGLEVEKQFFAAGSDSPVTKKELESGVFESVVFQIKDKNDNVLNFKKIDNADGTGYDYVLVPRSEAVTWSRDTTVEGGTDKKPVAKDDIVQDLVLRKVETTVEGVTSYSYVINVKGLDDGTYTLVEDAAPAGYNKAEDKEIVIKAETGNTQEWDDDATDPLTNFDENLDGKYDGDLNTEGNQTEYIDGKAMTIVENRKGSTLPGTGGIGTTMFYIGGGAMVAVAGVFLITKKRMNKKEN